MTAPHTASRLSAAGVLYGLRLHGLVRDALATRLYGFWTEPFTVAWRARFAAVAVRRWLAVNEDGAPPGLAGQGWTLVADEHWLHWRAPRGTAGLRHKLYIGCAAEALPATLARVAPLLEPMAVPAFKLGATPGGVLRPDRFVVYFESAAHRDEAGAALSRHLARGAHPVRAHGVPFTPALDPTGLVTWGYDHSDGPSWRQYAATALANAILAARAASGGLDAVRAGVRAAGIDPDRWTPLDWPGSAGGGIGVALGAATVIEPAGASRARAAR